MLCGPVFKQVLAQNFSHYNITQSYIRENKGQSASKALFIGTCTAGNVFFYRDSVVVQKIVPKTIRPVSKIISKAPGPEKESIIQDTVTVVCETFTFPGKNKGMRLIPGSPDGSTSNYFYGNDPAKWIKNVRNYKELIYKDIYAGIDYKISCSGDNIWICVEGENRNHPPKTNFNTNPRLLNSTYLGGTRNDEIVSMDVDEEGSIYLLAITGGYSFPVTSQAMQVDFGGYNDCAVMKFDSSGINLLFSTYVGGFSNDQAKKIFVRPITHGIIFGGTTLSYNFPTTSTSFDPVFNGGYWNGFVSCLGNQGDSLIYSTFIGSNKLTWVYDMDVDSIGNVYISGLSSGNFPVTAGSYQTIHGGGFWDMFLCKLKPTGSGIDFATYIGGIEEEQGATLAVDKNGNSILCCVSMGDENTSPNALSSTITGLRDYYLCKISPDGAAMLFGTYLGWLGHQFLDPLSDIVLDKKGIICIGFSHDPAYSVSNGVFTNGPSQVYGYQGPLALFKLSYGGDSLLFKTQIIAGPKDEMVNPSLFLYKDLLFVTSEMAGPKPSINWAPIPATYCAYDTVAPVDEHNSKCAVFALTADAGKLFYLSYYGGNRATGAEALIIRNDMAYIAGRTKCTDLPVFLNSLDTLLGTKTAMWYDGFFARFKIDIYAKASFDVPFQNCSDSVIIFQNTSFCSSDYVWSFGDGDTSFVSQPSHTYHNSGSYLITLVASNSATSDTMQRWITIQNYFLLHHDTICGGDSVFLAGEYRHQTGYYTDSLHTTIGCDSVIQTFLLVNEPAIINFPADTGFCTGSYVELDAGNPGCLYHWSNGLTTQTVKIDVPGIYSVTLTNGCTAIDSIWVIEVPPPLSSLLRVTTVCPGDVLVLETDTCTSCLYLWSDGSTLPYISISQPGTFILQISNPYCRISDTVFVEECAHLKMPNVFTPNSDGYNEHFVPEYENVEKFEMSIFNRWGSLIYKTNNLFKGWDGRQNDMACPEGTYYYVVEYEGTGTGGLPVKNRLQGTVMLLR